MVLLVWPPAEHLRIGRNREPIRALQRCRSQTRTVSVAIFRLDPRKSVRSFKGIICGDISEFESHMLSQAVPSLWFAGLVLLGWRWSPGAPMQDVPGSHRRRCGEPAIDLPPRNTCTPAVPTWCARV